MSDRKPTRDEFLQNARERIERDADTLDDDARRALRLARTRALDGTTGRSFGGWLPLTATATVAIVAVVAMRMTGQAPAVPELVESADAMTDIELLAETEDLALLEELEFYAWLSDAAEDVS